MAKEFQFGEKGEFHTRNVFVFLLTVLVIYCLYIPIISYYTWKFSKMKQAPWLQNRYPQLTILTVISLISVLFFGSMSGFLYINGLDHKWLLIVLFFILTSFSLFTHSIVCRIWLLYFKTRVNKATLNDEWQSVINPFKNVQKDPCPDNNANAFYLTNRKTYGNYQWMKKKLIKGLIFDTILLIALFITLLFVNNENKTAKIICLTIGTIEFVGNFVLPFIFIIHCYWFTPEFYDTLGLRQELLGTIKMYILTFLAFSLLCFGFAFDQFTKVNREGDKSVVGLIYITADWNLIAIILSYIALMMVKRYPERLAKMYTATNSSRSSTTLSPVSRTATMSPVKSASASTTGLPANSIDFVEMTDKQLKCIKIKDILQHEKCFEVFIEHLAHEYCMEGLLSIIEITQYRNYILLSAENELKQIYNNPINHKSVFSDSITLSASPDGSTPTVSTNLTMSTGDSTSVFDIGNRITNYYSLPQDIVKSEIVYPGYYKDPCPHLNKPTIERYMKKNRIEDKTERIKRYKEIAYEIFDKYIRIGSEYEINVSYQVRMKYQSLMPSRDYWINEVDDMDENELCRLFEDCYDEMIRLMSQSYSRFKLTEQFGKVTQVLQK